ncbi:FAD-binding oxidoreductase [Conexibacter sp. S30A1]|uniref:NAD(P)/FAD-dependent oxidoreductase n=1 Tax=Conexibacter sp. S30A1 TaxID=2937800 RepID=UPI00200DE769|nr:FAD-dependent oxidoreductase [Conexibacter sp. S30A1]
MPSVTFPHRSLTPADAVRGFWFDEVRETVERSAVGGPLAASTTADVCIVGGGFVGLWTAIELKQRRPNLRVVLLEADVCGGGASGRNGGFVMTWWSKFTSLVKLCGFEAAVSLAQRAEAAVREIGAFCEQHQIDAEFRPCGWLWAATNTEQVDAWSATVKALAAAGLAPFEPLSRHEVAALSGSPVHLAGVFERAVATVHPAKLARGLTDVARALGVEIHEHTAVKEIRSGEAAEVVTSSAVVRAATAVLAMNAWASTIPEVGRALVVVSSDVVATAPVPDDLDAIGWRDGPAVSDSRRLVNYYRTARDGRIVFGKGGGAVAPSGRLGRHFHISSPRQSEVTAQMRYVYPMLWQAPVVSAWRGPIDYSVTGLPFFCRLDGQPNVIAAAGFSGNGVGPAKLAGELLAQMAIAGDDAGLPHALTQAPAPGLPPEPIRYLGARLVRASLARKEAREDLGGHAGPLTSYLASLDPTSFVDRGEIDLPNPARNDGDGQVSLHPNSPSHPNGRGVDASGTLDGSARQLPTVNARKE